MPSSGGVYGASWAAFHVSKSASSRATISMRMLACERPQNSVHWPAKMPGSSASMRSVCTRPGTMSRLPLSRGIQKLWMTSRLVPRTRTLVPIGITIWPLVTIGSSMPPQPSCTGYSISHHHCWPVTLT